MPDNSLQIATYDRHYDLLQHYSSLLFKGRVSVITVCILIWAYVLGVGKDLGSTEFDFLGLHLESRGMVSLGAMFLLLSFMSLELAYARRFFEVLISGRLIEDEIGSRAFFHRYSTPKWSPMLQFYVVNELGLAVIFVAMMWSLNRDSIGITSACVSLVPFFWIVKSYRQLTQWVKKLSQKSTDLGR